MRGGWPHQIGGVGGGDGAVGADEGWLQLGHLLWGRGADPVVRSNRSGLA